MERLFNLREEVICFFAEDPSKDTQEIISNLKDTNFFLSLALLCDVSILFSQFNLITQGNNKIIFDYAAALETFEKRFNILESQLREGVLDNFKNTKEICDQFQMQDKITQYIFRSI